MSEIRGPFGLWSFPLLNMILQMMNRKRTSLGTVQPALTQQVTQNNEESWDLVRDPRGRLVNVVVHRKVTQNERD